MWYLYVSTGIFIIGLILFIVGIKKEKLTVEEAAKKHKEYIEELTMSQEAEYRSRCLYRQSLEEDIQRAKNLREIATERAAEAQAATNKVLASEQARLAAELQHRKELSEIEFEQETEKRQRYLDAHFARVKELEEIAYNKKKEELSAKIAQLQSQLDDFKARQDSVNEAILREKELKEKEDFYSIQVSENDQEDIKVLQSMDLKLHNRDVIPKLIWELYIRRPCQEMIKRITGGRKIGGIYKITYKETGEAYIGKTTDFATRWQNHCKTAIGLEGAARATLHNRLGQDGLWNYTFEILEEVDKDNLSSREAFYIDLYGTKQQLNMKNGDKNGTQ